MIIDAQVDAPPDPPSDLDRKADAAYGKAPEPPGMSLAALEVTNMGAWLRALETLLAAATTLDDVVQIAGHYSVRNTLAEAPTTIRANVNDMLRKAHERLAPGAGEDPPETIEGGGGDWPDDPIRELLADVDAMDLDAIETLHTSKAWSVKTRDLFPPDEERLREAIETRRNVLRAQRRPQT
jgi:hypothetical protein